ncbi:MAG: DUF721 domain-containing protein [Bdellovibrionales bacterium]|nr:DUF721 domain-containing protein [Bdellovibrionales bacterium]
MEKTLAAYRLDKKIEQYSAFPDWPLVVGEDIARVAKPEKILRGNTLVVRVLDAAWAQELSMLKTQLMDSIFEYGLGGTIVDIRFITGSPSQQQGAAPGARSKQT